MRSPTSQDGTDHRQNVAFRKSVSLVHCDLDISHEAKDLCLTTQPGNQVTGLVDVCSETGECELEVIANDEVDLKPVSQ